ncbi:btb/poz domain-containing protein npy2 [Quercus suber]|uniref:Btb/poz domain-containing protein npy2 n=1 Tax=Quercus suber TaxID=58331 RepID=A0AAW0LCG9_QUESU
MCRYVASELATDIILIVGDVKLYLHKFPLLSKSARLQKLVATTNEENADEVHISDIPGGPAAFEICVKFCYGMTATLNAYNAAAARYSIIVLQTTKTLLPLSKDLKVVSICFDSIATKAGVDVSKVDWSYTYNRKKLPEENGNDPNWNGVRNGLVPKVWIVSNDVLGAALKVYAYRRLPDFSKGEVAKDELVRRIGQQLEEASVNDLLIGAPEEETTMYDDELQETRKPGILSDASKLMVAKLIDGYHAEISKDANPPLLSFIDLAEMVSGISRPAHDGLLPRH